MERRRKREHSLGSDLDGVGALVLDTSAVVERFRTLGRG